MSTLTKSISSFLLCICLVSFTAHAASAFPWSLLSKLGSAAGKAGGAAAKAGGAAAKAGTAAKVSGAAAKVGVGKTASMSFAGAAAHEAAVGGKAATAIGASADEVVVGGRAAALGSLGDDGGRAAALSGEAAGEMPMGKFNTRRRIGAGEGKSAKGTISEHTVDAADAASNLIGYEDDEYAEDSGPGMDFLYGVIGALVLLGLGVYASKRSKSSSVDNVQL